MDFSQLSVEQRASYCLVSRRRAFHVTQCLPRFPHNARGISWKTRRVEGCNTELAACKYTRIPGSWSSYVRKSPAPSSASLTHGAFSKVSFAIYVVLEKGSLHVSTEELSRPNRDV